MKSLVGHRFGRLKVTAFAGFGRGVSRPFWCCLCECGNTCRVEGRLLLGTKDRAKHRQVSCGCARADPEVRREARMKVPAKKRAQICRKMRQAVTRKSIPYCMDVARAAALLDVSQERIEIMAKDKLLGHCYRRGAMWVSSEDVATLIATQERNKKRCKLELAGIAKASAKRMPWPEDYFRIDPMERKQGVQTTESPVRGSRHRPDQDMED